MIDKSRMLFRSAALAAGMGLACCALVAQDEAPPPPPPAAAGMQGGPHGGMDPGRRAEHLKRALGLTDDQTTQAKAIFEDSRSKMDALRSNTALSHEDRRSQMMALHQSENERFEALLTPDQKSKFESMEAQRHSRMHGDQGGPPPGDMAPPPPPPGSPQS